MANFELEDTNVEQRAKIKVIGVGGAGGNAVNAMIERGLNGVEFVVVNTDAQDLRKSLAPNRLQIGTRTTKGLGSGGDPNLGREAAIEDQACMLSNIFLKTFSSRIRSFLSPVYPAP